MFRYNSLWCVTVSMYALTPVSSYSRKLLCEVVRVKVESEERINRITRGNGEEIINVS